MSISCIGRLPASCQRSRRRRVSGILASEFSRSVIAADVAYGVCQAKENCGRVCAEAGGAAGGAVGASPVAKGSNSRWDKWGSSSETLASSHLQSTGAAGVVVDQTEKSLRSSSRVSLYSRTNNMFETRDVHSVVARSPAVPLCHHHARPESSLQQNHNHPGETWQQTELVGCLMPSTSVSKVCPIGSRYFETSGETTASPATQQGSPANETLVAECAGWGLQVCERLRDQEHVLLRRKTSRNERMLIHFQHQHRGAAAGSVSAACVCSSQPLRTTGRSRKLNAQDAIARWKQQQQQEQSPQSKLIY